MTREEESEFIEHIPCEMCGSSDANSLYSDGHQYCFACGSYVHSSGNTKTSNRRATRMVDMVSGAVTALGKRRISEETCRKFNYQVGDYKGTPVQIENFLDGSGVIVAQHLRFPNKDFIWLGDSKKAGLFGQHLWRDKGRMVVVTEGAIDCLTVSQLQDNKWPVVSIPSGSSRAKRDIAQALEWLLGFDEIVLFFDNDEPGRQAVEECAPLFPPGRCKIARMADFKDANEAHLAGRSKEIIDAIWGAKVYRPDGVINGNELWDTLTSDEEVLDNCPYPWEGLNQILLGLRCGELVTVTAGSGIGKSAIVREIAHHLLVMGETVGMLMLEETTKRTAKGLMGITMNKPIHLDLTPWSELPEEEKGERQRAYDATVGSGRLFLYDHFGSTAVDNLLNRIRYLAKGCGCKYVVLDHLSIVVSGIDDGDERKAIDVAMTKLRTLVQETGIALVMVSHLKRPSGDRGHEQGAEVALSQLRGSHSIAQLSDIVIGLERNQQDEQTKNITTVRVIKNRFTGETGIATHLLYDKETGRLTECRPEFVNGGESASEDDDAPF